MSELKVEGLQGAILLDAAEEAGNFLPFGCRTAKCGVCRVEVVEGTLTEPGTLESLTLERFRCSENMRLACQARVDGPVTVRTVHPKED